MNEPGQPNISRRDFIAAAGVTLLTPSLLSCQVNKNAAASLPNTDIMDEALEMMSKLGPRFNHCPMAAEALIALGRPEKVIPFVESYKRRFKMDYPDAVGPITEKNWKEALGRKERNTDWIRFFDNELKEKAWTGIIDDWAGILAPGLSAAGAHGILRTCHAVRGLAARNTPRRLHELAEGLGYWAAYYQPLTETRNLKIPKLKPRQAVERIPLLPVELRIRGSVMDQLKRLNDFAPFADCINLIDTAGKTGELLSEITETFATVYMKNVSNDSYFDLLHGITATTGVRTLLPYVSAKTTRKLLVYGWQTAAGLYSITGTGSVNKISDAPAIEKEDLIERAVATKDEHAIKLAEACLREYALNPKPVYLQAANDSLTRLPNYA